MPMRLTGLMSGMDTESIIQELVAVKQMKVDNLKKAQTKLEWKQDVWKELNAKVKKFYDKTMNSLKYQSAYSKKTTSISNSSIADIITKDGAMDSVQTLKVAKLAQSGYLTGAVISKEDGSKCTSGTKLTDMGIEAGSRIEVNTNGKTVDIEITDSMTLADLTKELNNAGVKANFDSKTQRFFIGASESGAKADFSITAANAQGTNALDKLGILVYDETSLKQYEALANLRTDADGYKAALDAEVADRLASYLKRAKALTDVISNQTKNLEEIKENYAKEYPDDNDFDALVNNTDGALDAMKADKKALEDKVEAGEELTEDEQKQLDTMKSKISYVEGYQKVQDAKTKNEEALNEVKTYYNEDDNAPSQKLLDDVSGWLDDKITKAEEVLANKDNLVGSVGATRVKGQDAEIYLNGAKFESSSNTFDINGLTITCKALTENEEVTLTTQNDTSGIYDMIKGFIKEYSTLINEMDKLYNAESAKDYEPLTDEEKEAMSESEVEKWEDKIKDSLLRRDSTLSSVSSAFKEIMSAGYEVNGKTMYLSDFGIETLSYFEAADNERNAYHIKGDEDDEALSGKTNELKAMISTDPDAVMGFFSELTKAMYEKTTDLMKAVPNYSSSFTLYEDKKMKSDYDDYSKKIAEMERKLKEYEDKWYNKFSAMEAAMAKMQSNANAVTGLIGG